MQIAYTKRANPFELALSKRLAGDIWNEVSILYNSDGYDGVMYSV